MRGEWFFRWMERRGSHRSISRDHQPYLERYYLFKGFGRCALFLHVFFASDIDDVHDHPWPWFRIILSGWYREYHHDGSSTLCGPGNIIFRSARELHRVEIVKGPVITLFGHGKRTRRWGFMVRGKWTMAHGQGGKTYQPPRTKGWLLPRVVK